MKTKLIFTFWAVIIPLLLKAVVQIPDNIDVNTEGDTLPLSDAPMYVVGVIILLVIGVILYLVRFRKPR